MNVNIDKGTGTGEKITVYHWLVVILASCGWLFDCMDQRLFVLARQSAMKEVLANNAEALASLQTYLGYATTAMIIGWATGGIFFGMMSDKWGRVKTMMATLLVYSGFTGLTGFAQTWVDFTIYRFLVGLGVGGMFGAATTLVAESVPGRFRSIALGSLQALSATGNILGSLITLWIPPGAERYWSHYSGWRILFFVGILPALLAIPIMIVLREPEAWKKAKQEAASGKGSKNIGSPIELFRSVRWRKNTLVGLFLGLSGMIGLWAVGFFSPELITTALQNTPIREVDLNKPAQICSVLKDSQNPLGVYLKEKLSPQFQTQVGAWDAAKDAEASALKPAMAAELNRLIQGGVIYNTNAFKSVTIKDATLKLVARANEKKETNDVLLANRQILEQSFPGAIASLQAYIDKVRGRGLALQDAGAFIGMMVITLVASFMGRRLAFLISFLLCLGITIFVFYSLKTETDAYWMLPMMGFAQLAVFACYSIYFPELFPTRLRGTGVGFCYNTVRYLAAPTPTIMGYLSGLLSFREAAIIMSFIYVVGIVALIWAPETKGKPLPED